jgi:hypothetical protein
VVVSPKGKKSGKTNIKQNHTKQKKKTTHKVSQVQMQYSFSKFSACWCSLVVVSSKVGREKKKRVWIPFCEWLSEAVAPLLAAVSLLLLEALFMQISGVSLTLTWPCRLCLLRVLLCTNHCYKLSPFQAHWGR